MFNVVYDPFLRKTSTVSEKNSFITPFLLCSYFRADPTTLLLKILGGRMHGPSSHLNFFGVAVPPVPLGLRPCIYLNITRVLNELHLSCRKQFNFFQFVGTHAQ